MPATRRSPLDVRRSPRARPASALAVALATMTGTLLGLYPLGALALEAEVRATTAAQGYSLRSPFGDPVLVRRRFLQTIALDAADTPAPDARPGDPRYALRLRLRFDGELGVDPSELTFDRADRQGRYVPGLREGAVDLMYGYLEGRRLLGGHGAFRLGRQYAVDSLGFWSFDGAWLRLEAPFVAVEAHAGFEQRGGLPLSTGRYERPGIWRGDRATQLADQPDVVPTFQQASIAPAWGAALEADAPGGRAAHLRIDYRKVWNTGPVTTNPFVDASVRPTTLDATRTSSERVGAAVDVAAGELVAARVGGVYDVVAGVASLAQASIDAFPSRSVSLGADVDRIRPTFDGDSIWNWFTSTPVTSATARVGVDPTDRLAFAASGGARAWHTDGAPDDAASAYLVDGLASAHARYRGGRGRVSLRAVLEAGQRGRREGLDAAVERDLRGRWLTALARASVYAWRDDLRPERSATSFGYVVGGAYRPNPAVEVLVELEHNMNRLVGQRYRALAVANFVVGP